jgi:hypothetical protein
MQKLFIEELLERYELGRSAFYDRLKSLGIKPLHEGKRAYLDAEHIQLTDELDAHIKAGGKIEEFVRQHLELEGVQGDGPAAELESEDAIEPGDDDSEEEVSGAIAIRKSEEIATFNNPDDETIELEFEPILPAMGEDEIKAIDEQAQYIAATRYVATHELADHYARTGKFTIPRLIEIVRNRRSRTAAAWKEAQESADPKSLSQLLVQKAQQKAAGVNANARL